MSDGSGAPREMIALGRIVNTHGIRGELRMLPHNPDTDVLRAGGAVTLRRGEARSEHTLRAVRRHKNLVLLTLAGVDSMTAAEALVGSEVEIPVAALPELAEGEAYHFQLLGLEVVTAQGETVGTVAEIFTTAANDVCVVRRGEREILIPYVDAIVRSVDLEARRLVIDPIPGLLEES